MRTVAFAQSSHSQASESVCVCLPPTRRSFSAQKLTLSLTHSRSRHAENALRRWKSWLTANNSRQGRAQLADEWMLLASARRRRRTLCFLWAQDLSRLVAAHALTIKTGAGPSSAGFGRKSVEPVWFWRPGRGRALSARRRTLEPARSPVLRNAVSCALASRSS